MIFFSAFVVGRVRDSAVDLARTRALQAWNLAQLLPAEAAPKPAIGAHQDPSCLISRAVESSMPGWSRR